MKRRVDPIVKPTDSSGYYWRQVSSIKWRLFSPSFEHVGTAHDKDGVLQFYRVSEIGHYMLDDASCCRFDMGVGFDDGRSLWQTKVIVKILQENAKAEMETENVE